MTSRLAYIAIHGRTLAAEFDRACKHNDCNAVEVATRLVAAWTERYRNRRPCCGNRGHWHDEDIKVIADQIMRKMVGNGGKYAARRDK